MKKLIIRTGLVVAGALTVAGGIVSPASAALNDAHIKNNSSSDRTMTICRDWGTTSCKSTSYKGYLSPGQNSKTKYPSIKDWDGFYIPSGCRDNYGVIGPKWKKVPGANGLTKAFTLEC